MNKKTEKNCSTHTNWIELLVIKRKLGDLRRAILRSHVFEEGVPEPHMTNCLESH